MGTAVALRDVVGKTEYVLLIGLVPLQGDLNADIVALGEEMKDLFVQRGLVPVQVLDEGANTALIFEDVLAVTAVVA